MMDEFIHRQRHYLLLSTTWDQILSWMIEIWMENDLVSDSSCNTVNLSSPPKKLQGVTKSVELTFTIGNTIQRFTIGIEQDRQN